MSLALEECAGANGEGPDADETVGVSGEEGLSVGGPADGDALWWLSHHLGLQFLHDSLLLQVPDLDDGASGGAEPVAVGREAERVDLLTAVKGVKGLKYINCIFFLDAVYTRK